MAGVEGVLLDIDGVLVTSWHPIDGAVAAVREVRERGLACAYLTNTTSRTCDEIADALRSAGIEADSGEIVTAARLTAEYVRSTYPGSRAWVLNSGDITADLSGIELDDEDPEVVILGGAGPEFTHDALSRVVELMLDGVPVVAMHRGTTWATHDGLRIDTGTYLPGMEEVAGTNVVSVGKPSLAAFLTATDLMGTEPDVTVMVGDDLTNDVLAAQRVGLTGVLVRTGKFRQSILDLAPQRPDHVVDSVAQLPKLLDELA
ncbi:HAD-IIA family hydrolase [Rhodococcus sp. NM-2]|uniref:HAD-IIA family hydrolase n=1 Tax=Rhodococcus TaxID=1827 RepID=UPI0024734C72|nr:MULTISPECIES: HAD-IIA family hydrolase [Rhodococcus]MDH6286608.1 HAD superfamily hydrolase (TIGR01450 family) [Rhodococcus opacus]MDI9954425.1 HAD-IIA family hydrolase [Rhodococcus sp. IEGM 1305]MDI9979906.1 HAD-IIA family hydrolase [Rhodococcus sp. IEGM 1307]